MTDADTSSRRVRWEIQTSRAVYEGPESLDLLGDLFAMFIRGRGDVSTWVGAPLFGAFVAEHSDLRREVVAVLLGIDPGWIEAVDASDLSPPVDFPGIDGNSMTLDRWPVE